MLNLFQCNLGSQLYYQSAGPMLNVFRHLAIGMGYYRYGNIHLCDRPAVHGRRITIVKSDSYVIKGDAAHAGLARLHVGSGPVHTIYIRTFAFI